MKNEESDCNPDCYWNTGNDNQVGIEMLVEHVQKTALLGTARVLRLVLGS